MTPRSLSLAVLIALAGCHRKVHHPPAPAAGAESPGLSISSKKLNFGDQAQGYQFTLQGRPCNLVAAKLLRITADETYELTSYEFRGFSDPIEGTLCLLIQNGNPFGLKDQKIYSLGESMPGARKTRTSSGPAHFQGPFSTESEEVTTGSSMIAGKEHIVLVCCMSKRQEGHSFGAGDLESLKKHAAQTKDEIVAVTIRWE